MGVEAWRRISRFIDHGRDIRLGTLRNEVRMIRGRFVIKCLESVLIGVAKSENKIDEFVAAGGNRPDDQEMKSDLNAILPAKLSELLCMKQSDSKMSYGSFKGFVEHQTGQILINAGRLPINAVGEKVIQGREAEEDEDEEEAAESDINGLSSI